MDDYGRTSATSRPSTMPSPPSTRPSDARGRQLSAFVRERHAPIDARGRPALSRSVRLAWMFRGPAFVRSCSRAARRIEASQALYQTLGCGKRPPETDDRNATIRRPIRRFSAKCFQRFPAKYRGHFFGSRNVSPMRRLVDGPNGTRTSCQTFFLSLGNVVRKACTSKI